MQWLDLNRRPAGIERARDAALSHAQLRVAEGGQSLEAADKVVVRNAVGGQHKPQLVALGRLVVERMFSILIYLHIFSMIH